MYDKRKVTRVLVMLEYGPDDPNNGEVFDLTALVSEIQAKNKDRRSEITLEVECAPTYRTQGEKTTTGICWKSYSPDYTPLRSGHLVDLITATLPDDERVTRLKEASERLRKRASALQFEAGKAKIGQAASLRHLHAVAKVSESPLAALGEE